MPALQETYRPQEFFHENDFSRNRNLRPIEAESVSIPSLADEVRAIRLDPEKEKACLLGGTGMHVSDEIRALRQDVLSGVPIHKALLRTEENVKGFETEYLAQMPVFGINIKFGEHNNSRRIIGGTEAGGLWLDSTSSVERDGTVKESVDKMEQFLLTGEPGSMAVMISPGGWSGYQVHNETKRLEPLNHKDIMRGVAQEITFPDLQTYVISIGKNGEIKAHTLKSGMTLSQSEKLHRKLGGEKIETEGLTEKERIKRLVSNVLFFSPKDNINAENIVDISEHILGTSVQFTDQYGKDRTSQEAKYLLQNPDVLNSFKGTSKHLMDSFKEYASVRMKSSDSEQTRDLEVGLGLIVLQMMYAGHSLFTEQQTMAHAGMYDVQKTDKSLWIGFDPRSQLKKMQELPGCAGGGIKVDSAGASRVGVLGQDTHGSSEVVCPDCGRVNKRMPGQLLPKCGAALCQSKTIACEPVKITSQEKSEEKVTSIQKKPAQSAKKAA